MFGLIGAARAALRQVESARRADGVYRLTQWPAVAGAATGDPRAAVVRLRVAQRLTAGFLDPVDDAIYLTAGLRRLGHPATLHLGRELCPAASPAGVYPWVECDGRVVSTSLPVAEEYVEVLRLPAAVAVAS